MLSFCTLVFITTLSNSAVSLAPVEEDMDWESFEAALNHESEEEDALNLLQSRASVFNSKVTPDTSYLLERVQESADKISDISPDTLDQIMESDEMLPEAVSLIQTDAHFEWKSVPGHIAVVTEADGSNALVEDVRTKSNDGTMHMSVGADGKFHLEDVASEISLLQKEASLTSANVKAPEDEMKLSEKEKQATDEVLNSVPDVSEPPEALSLMQADARRVIVTESDGTNAPFHATSGGSKNGMMQLSIGADGMFHQMDAAGEVSLLQREASLTSATINTPEHEKDSQEKMLNIVSDASGTPEALSLMQADASRVIVTESDRIN